MDTVERNEYTQDCVVTSFHYEFLKEVKKLNSSVRTGYIYSAPEMVPEEYPDVDLFSISYSFLDEELIKRIHRQGKEVHGWTVNEEADIRMCKQWNVDNIITNDNGTVRKILSE